MFNGWLFLVKLTPHQVSPTYLATNIAQSSSPLMSRDVLCHTVRPYSALCATIF